MIRRAHTDGTRHDVGLLHMTQEMSAILTAAGREINDQSLIRNVYFSPTALTHIRRLLENGGTIITDTMLVANGIDKAVLVGKNVQVKCFIDSMQVNELAAQRKITRAEVAADYALSEPGLKLLVFGSAPAGIQRVMKRRQIESLSDVCMMAGATGFASLIQLKERLAESDITSIVIRGKMGGIPMTVSLLNAILRQISQNKR